jgi:hypothetical protein
MSDFGGKRTNRATVATMPRLFTCVLLLSPLLLSACDDRSSAKDFASWCWRTQQHGDNRQGRRWLIYKYAVGPQVADGPILLRPYICANVTAAATFARSQDEIAIRSALRQEAAKFKNEMFALVVRGRAKAAKRVGGDFSITVEKVDSITAPKPPEQGHLLGRFEQAGAFDAYTDAKDGTRRSMPPMR